MIKKEKTARFDFFTAASTSKIHSQVLHGHNSFAYHTLLVLKDIPVTQHKSFQSGQSSRGRYTTKNIPENVSTNCGSPSVLFLPTTVDTIVVL